MNSVPNLVFNPPAAGKPDPSLPPPLPGKADTRPRVAQHGTKSNTCWYYAYATTRDRFGKHASVQHTPERQFEKAASERRKALSKHESSLPGLCDQLNQPTVKNILSRMTPSDPSGGIPPHLTSALFGNSPELSAAQQAFTEQKAIPDFFEFLVDQKFGLRSKINRDFLTKVGVKSVDALVDAKIKQQLTSVRGEIRRSRAAQASMLDAVVRNVCAEKYGLAPIKWAPVDGLAPFFTAVEMHGSLIVGGLFGKSMYTDPPYKMGQQVGGRDIYAWKPGSARAETAAISAHTVVVVGVRKQDNEKGMVYYIDPDDGSDPSKSMSQPIYAMSFASLTKYIATLDGVMKAPSQAKAGFALARGARRDAA
jgi:hypothetical protein